MENNQKQQGVRECAGALYALMGIAGGARGGGRMARALRFLVLLQLLVMALTALKYLSASVFEARSLRSYLHTPVYNATLPTLKTKEKPQATTKKPFSTTKKVLETTTFFSKINKVITTVASSTETANVTNPALPYCEVPSNLGPIPVSKTEIELSSIEYKFPEVSIGGWYKPPNCTARHRVAIIVPYRDRPQNLALFLNHMHPFLIRQQLDYGIFIIEQQDSKPTASNFNRAKLFNVGFVESNRAREGGWQCFVFHDVDLLPMDERNLYTCPRQPRHMSSSLDEHNFKLLYQDLFGGVSGMTYEQFTKVNGFSNKYWGWGGEDDDMFYRIRKMKYYIARYKMSIARYTMLEHKPQAANLKRHKLLLLTNKNFKKDGLSSLEYELIKVVKHRLFTQVSVNLDEHS